MGDNLRFDSKILGIFTALFVIAVVISAANAADLVDEFNNENFKINVPSGCDFSQNATTDVNVGEVVMSMIVFENTGNNSNNVSSITYLNDSSADKKIVSDVINDLKKDGEIVEENGNYTIVKTQNITNSDVSVSDIENGINSIMGFANDLFSSNGDLNFSADGNSISLSDKGLEIADANGTNVSISSEGIKVSEGDELSNDTNITVDGNMSTDFNDGDYVAFLTNQDNNQLILISGNNLDSLKAMADTVSFK